eukprot:1374872-Amorphochlora_amoeboformis.AAC.1
MSTSIDELLQDQNKFSYNQRQVQRLKQQQQQQRQKMEAKLANGETADDETTSVRRNIPYLPRMDAYLVAHKITHYSKKLRTMIGQSMTKMFEVDALCREQTAPSL